MNATLETPRVWVGCLACYNGGDLEGEWYDAADAPVEMEGAEGFNNQTSSRPRAHFAEQHEELWVMDFEGFHGLLMGECSPSTAREIAEALDTVSDLDAFEAWGRCSEFDTPAEAVEAFEDASYQAGESFQDAAYEYLDETGAFEGLPDFWDGYRWHLAGVWLSSMSNGGAVREVYHNGTHYLFMDY